jgi:hypothetical protein
LRQLRVASYGLRVKGESKLQVASCRGREKALLGLLGFIELFEFDRGAEALVSLVAFTSYGLRARVWADPIDSVTQVTQ